MILLLIYLAGVVLLIWPIASAIIEHDRQRFTRAPDSEDWVLALAMSTLAAMLWPLALMPAASFLLWRRLNQPAPADKVEDRP